MLNEELFRLVVRDRAKVSGPARDEHGCVPDNSNVDGKGQINPYLAQMGSEDKREYTGSKR